ncbi:LysR family transcriptional regulator [Staphylococcus lutrae]|uniref:LysR family transcriptional regulator n=1 Tax=Staphylococcus lutrae TaxID=155085 RepID=A0AAC9RTD5_9STAP|nr:LysR family transcriptional regulator [Staphylococcus lutrae]ARJ50487.1 LysR family transcriptional regulator [Staphylococcus lutrae]PNZ38215.1 LysR family transcriptional regulator [Staphylococcus lutrae]
MKVIQLEYFIEIVHQNSFTKAAQVLHISQPSLTAAIKKMENELGYQLLKRTTKEISITEKGIQFYNEAIALVKHYHQSVEKMYDLKISQTPKIKMAVIESTARWVATVVQTHHQIHPEQHYQITEILDPHELAQKLIQFDIHLGLSNDQIRHEHIHSLPLYQEDYVLLVPHDTFDNQKSISIKDLPLIVPNQGYQVRKHIDDYFTRLEIPPNIIMEVDRFESATNFVHQGMGYAVIPQMYAQSYATFQLNAVKIRPNIQRTIYLNFSKKREYNRQFFDLVRACCTYWQVEF